MIHSSFPGQSIVELTDDELGMVDGGLKVFGLVVGIAAALVYLGGELHDATCDDHD